MSAVESLLYSEPDTTTKSCLLHPPLEVCRCYLSEYRTHFGRTFWVFGAMRFSQFSLITALVLFFAGTRLHAKNVTVDDADTKMITYSSGWKTSNNCPTCFAKPNKTQAFGTTWHDGTTNRSTSLSFTFAFTGTYVEARYIALDIINTTVATGTNVSYSIDGVERGTAFHIPADRSAYLYNQTLFSVTGLTNAEHTLRVDLLKPSVLLLDSLIFDDGILSTSQTTTSPGSNTSSPVSLTSNDTGSITNLGAIIGGGLAGVIVLVLGAVLVRYSIYCRHTSQTGALPTPWSEGNITLPPQLLPATGSISPRASLIGTSLVPAGRSSPLAVTYVPSVPEADNANQKLPLEMSPYSVHGTTARGTPSSRPYTNVVANRVQAQIPDEPVEGGLISRQGSMRSILPPYSPGGFPG